MSGRRRGRRESAKMKFKLNSGLALIAALALPTAAGFGAQEWPAVGLYQIVSGRYAECCGIVALPFNYSLPYTKQAYVELAVDAQAGLARMAILGDDLQTVHTTDPTVPESTFTYDLTNGIVLGDEVRFESPVQIPENPSWTYSVSNSGNGLWIQGTADRPQCCDYPTQFRHTNVVAVLVSTLDQPVLGLPRVGANGAVRVTVVEGSGGRTNVIETSGDLFHWAPVSTNVFPFMDCPVCPFIDFEDAGDSNGTGRFYRSYSLP